MLSAGIDGEIHTGSSPGEFTVWLCAPFEIISAHIRSLYETGSSWRAGIESNLSVSHGPAQGLACNRCSVNVCGLDG